MLEIVILKIQWNFRYCIRTQIETI